jgi:hypothetical protein
MERRAVALRRFAVPAAIIKLLVEELLCQCIVRFRKIGTDDEDPPVNAGLRFAMKIRPVVERLEHQPLFDAVDHDASLLASGVETEVLSGRRDSTAYKVPLPAGPCPSARLFSEKLGSPAFSRDARPLGGNLPGASHRSDPSSPANEWPGPNREAI